MTATNASVRTTLRIPGVWSDPGELLERLPAGFRLTPETLWLPDGAAIEFIAMPPDEQFAQIFASSCRQPAADDELAAVRRYTVNIGLSGPGGSRDAALAMLQAGAALVRKRKRFQAEKVPGTEIRCFIRAIREIRGSSAGRRADHGLH
ncbi:MAG TPA: hypothetical protein VMV10_14225 [Pirellulales bacterium]|nr:hypothetical protein [Pirellulales bacterium]